MREQGRDGVVIKVPRFGRFGLCKEQVTFTIDSEHFKNSISLGCSPGGRTVNFLDVFQLLILAVEANDSFRKCLVRMRWGLMTLVVG